MFRLLFFLAVCTLVSSDAHGRERKAKTPDLQTIEINVKREENLITIEARLKNSGSRPLRGLRVIFRFEDNAGKTLTTQRIQVDEDSLNPGAESEVNAQMKDSPSATQVTVFAQTGEGSDLRVGNAGPFPVAE